MSKNAMNPSPAPGRKQPEFPPGHPVHEVSLYDKDAFGHLRQRCAKHGPKPKRRKASTDLGGWFKAIREIPHTPRRVAKPFKRWTVTHPDESAIEYRLSGDAGVLVQVTTPWTYSDDCHLARWLCAKFNAEQMVPPKRERKGATKR